MSQDDLPKTLYTVAKIIYEARKKEAFGWMGRSFETPKRENYKHNPHADFDLCLASAKAIMAHFEIKEE